MSIFQTPAVWKLIVFESIVQSPAFIETLLCWRFSLYVDDITKTEYLSSTCSEVYADFQRQFSCTDDAHNKIQTVGGGSGVSYGRDLRFVEIAVLSTESTILAKSE